MWTSNYVMILIGQCSQEWTKQNFWKKTFKNVYFYKGDPEKCLTFKSRTFPHKLSSTIRLLSNLLSYDSFRSFCYFWFDFHQADHINFWRLPSTNFTWSIFEYLDQLMRLLLNPSFNCSSIDLHSLSFSFSVYSWLLLPTVSFSETWPEFKLLPLLIVELTVKISITAALVSIF